MNKILSNTQMFIKRNSSTILTCVGAVGVVATAITAVKATPKAIKVIEANEELKGEKLTKLEKIKYSAPAYIPTIVIGAATITCIFGANVLNKRHQAALVSAYTVLDSSYKEYKEQVKDIFGEDGARKVIHGIAKNHYDDTSDTFNKNDGKQLFFDFYSLQYFKSTIEEVEKAERLVNDLFETRGYVSLSEFYDALGITSIDTDHELGWSSLAGHHYYGYNHVDFIHERLVMEDGTECCVITMPFEPTADYLF